MVNAQLAFSVRVDASNPGEFLACCGLLELADRLSGMAEGWFSNGMFTVTGDTTLRVVVERLIASPAIEVTEPTPGLNVKSLIAPLQLVLGDGDRQTLWLDAWMTIRPEKGVVSVVANRPWNFWSGQQTSLRIWTNLRAALQQQISTNPELLTEALLQYRVPLSGRFGFDPGAAWNSLDVGFSPNEQGIEVASSPAVELLAAVGLQRFRPVVAAQFDSVAYSTWTQPLAPAVAAVACTGCLRATSGIEYRAPVTSRGNYAALGYSTTVKGHRDE